MEVSSDILRVEGSIPPELDGAYLRNGPDPIDHNFTKHWFVSDGMLPGVDLSGGAARWYRNRYGKTKMLAEKRGTDTISDGAMGSHNAANTNVVSHGGKVFALGGVDNGASHPEPEVIQGCLLKGGASAARFADGVRKDLSVLAPGVR
ncbi:carotenoid oxygenase family protein [Pseudoroseomonas wenyumeiae]